MEYYAFFKANKIYPLRANWIVFGWGWGWSGADWLNAVHLSVGLWGESSDFLEETDEVGVVGEPKLVGNSLDLDVISEKQELCFLDFEFVDILLWRHSDFLCEEPCHIAS